MFSGTSWSLPVLVIASLATVADCSAQMIGQKIPDGEQVEVRRLGQSRRGVVSGYMFGEYSVQYSDGPLDFEWVPEAEVILVPRPPPPKEFDLAPLYQALGAASCPIALLVFGILYALGVFGRKPAVPQVPPVRYPPQQP